MIKRFASLLVLSVLLSALLSGSTHATTAPLTEKGLLITPIRQFLSADAGVAQKNTFTIANLTDNPLNVNLSIKQFSVTDYVYNYTFNQPNNEWLHLGITDVTLAPNQSQNISYSINVPAGSAPGGHYYTLFASANLSSQGVNNTIQAADLVYLTVKGQLTHTSYLRSSSIPLLAFGRTIPFSLDPINTGNVYFFAYVSGQLHGLFVKAAATPDTHLLMPGKVRAVAGSIPSPVLPGVYKATYGYKTDTGQTITKSRLVIFIPPWFIALVLAALLLTGKLLPRRKKKHAAEPRSSDEG